MILLKFGKEENLKEIQKGLFYFRPIESYHNDLTVFRGDPMEGKLKIELSEPLLINGFDISPYLKHVTISQLMKGNILSSSFSMLHQSNCHVLSGDIFTPDLDFIETMKQFGDYFISVESEQVIMPLRYALSEKTCNYEYHSIFYCNKNNYKDIHTHFQMIPQDEITYGHLFIKDYDTYAAQHEWRFIIHDFSNEFSLAYNGGTKIQTIFRTEMPVFRTEQLRTLRISKDLLL